MSELLPTSLSKFSEEVHERRDLETSHQKIPEATLEQNAHFRTIYLPVQL